MCRTNAVFSAVLTVLLSPGWQGSSQETNAQSKEKGGDADFAYKASEINLAEISLGRLAIERASSPEVKQFGQQMVTDHTRSQNELSKIAAVKGFKTAMKVDAKHEALAEELSRLTGEKFDQQYMSHMVMGHKKALAAYQYQAKNGMDPELKAFAGKGASVVEAHLKMAERISRNSEVKGKSQ